MESDSKPKASPGRPRALDDAKKSAICALMTTGCSQRQAAVYVGVAPSTVSKEMSRDRAFLDASTEALRKRETDLLADIRAAGKKSWRAAAWLLEKTCGGKYLRRPKLITKEEHLAVFDVLANAIIDTIEDPDLRDKCVEKFYSLSSVKNPNELYDAILSAGDEEDDEMAGFDDRSPPPESGSDEPTP